MTDIVASVTARRHPLTGLLANTGNALRRPEIPIEAALEADVPECVPAVGLQPPAGRDMRASR
jgi:hypothetical protein